MQFSALTSLQKALQAGVIVGLTYASGSMGSNLMNAEFNARKEGIVVSVCVSSKILEAYSSANMLSVRRGLKRGMELSCKTSAIWLF